LKQEPFTLQSDSMNMRTRPRCVIISPWWRKSERRHRTFVLLRPASSGFSYFWGVARLFVPSTSDGKHNKRRHAIFRYCC